MTVFLVWLCLTLQVPFRGNPPPRALLSWAPSPIPLDHPPSPCSSEASKACLDGFGCACLIVLQGGEVHHRISEEESDGDESE